MLTWGEGGEGIVFLSFSSRMDQRGSESVALDEILSELRQTFRTGRTRPVAWRKAQLRAIIDLVQDNEERIFTALLEDLGKHPVESYRDEVGVVLKSAKQSLSCVEKWMAPKKGHLPLLFFPASGEVLPEPLGTVLIFSSWNFPISLALDPVIGAVAAGNTVVLKPSELAPACSSFLAETLPRYLDNRAVKVVTGGPNLGEQLLEQKWDKIFFTGSPQVGRIVMSAAARHLTPVTLELGGKCPTIVDTLSSTSEIKITVKRIAGGKWGPCSGQACIGIDYLLVEKKFCTMLVDLLMKTIRRFYGEGAKNMKNMCKIINKHQFERLQNLLKDPAVAASIVYGGSVDEERLLIEPTILLDPPLDAEIMTEEIFGPLLPIITLNNIQESIEFINARPKPLAMYVFTKDESFKQQLLQETSSGSVTFNDVMVQFICDSLPFGGVGQSGFGRYHGKYSFDAFSHEKAVMRRGFFPEIEPRYPPWNDFKLKFIRLAYNFDYLGLLLLMLGLKRN
ncbi:aldehyde dehydrogenase family 3 member F1 isoform X2 [Punica granatum]|uniref:Aldehyde dehydrogenase n=1 Tax=Punica granatum TaxID=22663 RepID=A0A6P8DZ76_PUNGR|nr:aldehyde dehydrogenase family 3 member F1 isoform X2 [Punica granatum]